MSISTPQIVNLGRAGLLCAAAIALSACVYEGPYDDGYCGYPVYDGGLWYSGEWYGGHHRYRDHDGHREYWIGGGWHHAETEGGGRRYHHRSY